MRAIDADEVMEHVWRDRLDSRELIAQMVKNAPTIEPEHKTGRLSNKEWIDFLVAQFDISRTSARDMLHVMMQVKREDNFKKQFSGAERKGGE